MQVATEFAALGAVAVTNPLHLLDDRAAMLQRLGPARSAAGRAFAFRTLQQASILFCFMSSCIAAWSRQRLLGPHTRLGITLQCCCMQACIGMLTHPMQQPAPASFCFDSSSQLTAVIHSAAIHEQHWLSRWICAMQAGASQAFGSDWPVVPLDALGGIYAAAHRRAAGSDGTPFEPAERLSLEDSLRLHTAEAARSAFLESEVGTLRYLLHYDNVPALSIPCPLMPSARFVRDEKLHPRADVGNR